MYIHINIYICIYSRTLGGVERRFVGGGRGDAKVVGTIKMCGKQTPAGCRVSGGSAACISGFGVGACGCR